MRNIYSVLLVSGMLAISGCGGGGGGSSSSSGTVAQKPRPGKAFRSPLMAQNVNTTYSESGTYHPIVNNQFGQLTFRLADGEPTDVVSVDKYTGSLTILNPGDVRIYVEDNSSVYKTSSDTFTVHIEKSPNFELSASQLTISTLETEAKYLDVRGKQGTLIYDVSSDSAHLIDVDHYTGAITPRGIDGWATVIISDSGNRRYESKTYKATVRIKTVNPGSLEYGKISRPYSEGLTITPQKVSGGDEGIFNYYLSEYHQDSDVLTIDSRTGQMDVKKTGTVVIKVVNKLDESYEQDSRIAYFQVDITKGPRPKLTVNDASFPYSPDHVIKPAANNAKGQVTYRVESDDDAIVIDSNTRLPKIVGVGTTTLVATDNSDTNYEPSTDRFDYIVNEAAHPGLANKTITYVFTEDAQQRQLTPHFEGQKGQLTFSGPTNVVSNKPGKLFIEHAGTTKLTAKDDGGQNYLSAEAELTVTIEKAPHPALQLNGINRTYESNLCINLSEAAINGNKGSLSISLRAGEDNSVVTYDAENKCFKAHKQGTAVFDVVSLASQDYKESAPQALTVVINPADSAISVDEGITAVYSKGQKLKSPDVVGKKGTLAYEIASFAKKDVVDINPNTGELTLLNVGSTAIKVTDSGANGFNQATTTFTVDVTKAELPADLISVTLPEMTFEAGKHFFPEVEGNDDGEFKLGYYTPEYYGPARAVNQTIGDMEIRSAGKYEVRVTVWESRNYNTGRFSVWGTINRAPHPGISAGSQSIDYVPLKEVTLEELPKTHGVRNYSMTNTTFKEDDTYKAASIDENNGLVVLGDFHPLGKSIKYDINITETESKNFLALTETPEAEKELIINPPKPGTSDLDFTLKPLFTIFTSGVNGNSKYKNLEGTSIHFAGIRSVFQPTSEQLRTWGEGVTLVLNVKKSDSDRVSNSVKVYVQRYVGCQDEVNLTVDLEHNPKDMTPRKMDYTGSCYGSYTNQILTFRVIDRESLGEGDWELVTPFVVYRKSVKLFSANNNGGMHLEPSEGRPPYGDEPTHLIEWNRVDLKFTN
ncbi:hypothetical protein [uncultured Photobacterium sp.]|uniref:hypothetical protein n=1 Tax=uncultured Photobacterium sp. TaxID=173973 RepID=UPI0026338332|nr:hypothetical protein [uncultured Photobacterium sp.]